MSLTAEQHAEIAATYEKAAADHSVSAEQRAAFAKKADWFRQLARLETKRTAPAQSPDPAPTPDARVESRPRYLLASLWLVGAALYAAGTLLFTIAVNPAEDGAKTTTISKEASVPEASVPDARFSTAPAQPRTESNRPDLAGVPQLPATASPPIATAMADRRHAISPDEPTYESPSLTVPLAPAKEESAPPPAPSAPAELAASAQTGDALEVIETATVRSAPSTDAEKIGTASPGAALRVKARQGDWVQFVDPASGNTGWIHASLVGPAAASEASPEADEPVAAPKHADAGKKQPAQKPRATAQAEKQRNARPNLPPPPQRRYVDLPNDEEFFVQQPRQGILARRRMMREGLMSPDFLPPR